MASSILSSQGMVLATAMAVSGTVILLAFRLQKPFPLDQPSQQSLRSCICSSEGKKKKKKKVHFAEDVMDPRGDGEEFRRQLTKMMTIKNNNNKKKKPTTNNSSSSSPKIGEPKNRGMPANRVALYNGMLRDRVVQRCAYSY